MVLSEGKELARYVECEAVVEVGIKVEAGDNAPSCSLISRSSFLSLFIPFLRLCFFILQSPGLSNPLEALLPSECPDRSPKIRPTQSTSMMMMMIMIMSGNMVVVLVVVVMMVVLFLFYYHPLLDEIENNPSGERTRPCVSTRVSGRFVLGHIYGRPI